MASDNYYYKRQYKRGAYGASQSVPAARRNGRKKARGNPQAKAAMELLHSGQANSLKNAWKMVKNGARSNAGGRKSRYYRDAPYDPTVMAFGSSLVPGHAPRDGTTIYTALYNGQVKARNARTGRFVKNPGGPVPGITAERYNLAEEILDDYGILSLWHAGTVDARGPAKMTPAQVIRNNLSVTDAQAKAIAKALKKAHLRARDPRRNPRKSTKYTTRRKGMRKTGMRGIKHYKGEAHFTTVKGPLGRKGNWPAALYRRGQFSVQKTGGYQPINRRNPSGAVYTASNGRPYMKNGAGQVRFISTAKANSMVRRTGKKRRR